MFGFIRRPEPQRRLLGEFGISEAEYDRIVARIRAERAGASAAPRSAAATRPNYRLSTVAEGISA